MEQNGEADKADEHEEQLRRDRANILDRIQAYHRYIDECTAEMTVWTSNDAFWSGK